MNSSLQSSIGASMFAESVKEASRRAWVERQEHWRDQEEKFVVDKAAASTPERRRQVNDDFAHRLRHRVSGSHARAETPSFSVSPENQLIFGSLTRLTKSYSPNPGAWFRSRSGLSWLISGYFLRKRRREWCLESGQGRQDRDLAVAWERLSHESH